MKRVVLFLVTNLAVMLVLSVATSVLGVNRYLTPQGLNLGMLLGFAAVIGFGGAIISLLMSKPIAKWSTGAQIINDSRDPTHAWIVEAVRGTTDRPTGGKAPVPRQRQSSFSLNGRISPNRTNRLPAADVSLLNTLAFHIRSASAR